LARFLASGRHLGPPSHSVKDGRPWRGADAATSACSGAASPVNPAPGHSKRHSRRYSKLGRAMIELLQFISYLLTIYVYIVIAMAILSWLIAFNVVNTRNPVVRMIAELLYRLTEPALRPIRNLLPNMGGIDISPIILFLIILFIQSVILPNIAKLFI
jgi:YggT family protein